ncbi:DUF4402 domain-containing protein [Christiangramia sp. SM2212]|uniref:DUF4402 domain-containing protein n=1 Tax=Christiangramia sediminicola TaxID=3073267 RepID=A0ABU1EP96_9FLAO|nr:DUF4402 domain-containing protein [Christiangramia sp. SM2212]MDR5590216.1 DUF4402 domain-containing protein [Christiangramia sp. SM2212]
MRIALLYLLLFSTSFLYSQNSANTSVRSTAVVVEPIEIEKNVDLHFGNVISSFNPGRLILSPDGNRTTFGVDISSANPGEVSAAEAIVTHGSYDYTVTLPETFKLYNQNNPNQFLIIDEFTVSPETSAENYDVLKIGATLNIQANQSGGLYTNNSGFTVTVTYN